MFSHIFRVGRSPRFWEVVGKAPRPSGKRPGLCILTLLTVLAAREAEAESAERADELADALEVQQVPEDEGAAEAFDQKEPRSSSQNAEKTSMSNDDSQGLMQKEVPRQKQREFQLPLPRTPGS